MSQSGDDLSFYASRPSGPPVAPQAPTPQLGAMRPAQPPHAPAPYGVQPYPPAHAQQAAAIAVLGKKSSGLAAVLSILLVGAGQMYCGRVGRGLAFLAASVVSAMLTIVFVGVLLLPVVFIWALVDAIQLANRHNAELARRLSLGGYGY